MHKINPGKYFGEAHANPSKSMMQRVVAAAILADGTTVIQNPCYSDDCIAAIEIARSFGAEVNGNDPITVCSPDIQSSPAQIQCGESGLSARMFPPILSLHSNEVTINGEGSLKNRSMGFFEDTFSQLGVSCSLSNGKLPMVIQGPLRAGIVHVNGSLTSQFLTGLLMALAGAKGNSVVHVSNLNSKGYVDLTLDVLNRFGVSIENRGYTEFHIEGNQKYKPCEITIEGDWSGAAFHLVGGAISEKATIYGLQPDSKQPDKKILEVIVSAGGNLQKDEESITVSKGELRSFDFDATDCPDLFPPLAALAANCDGVSKISGVERLFNKESNRAESIMSELANVGVQSSVSENTMHISGGKISSGIINSNNDHRIVMMGAILAVNATGPIDILNTSAINKSYPEFFQTLASFGIEAIEC
jgi:3-phosphoshikimate 1-carboxyvinyltransferase